MEKTLICYLVEQYLETLKLWDRSTLHSYTAARAGGNHNKVSLLSGQYRGFSNLNTISLTKDKQTIIPSRV